MGADGCQRVMMNNIQSTPLSAPGRKSLSSIYPSQESDSFFLPGGYNWSFLRPAVYLFSDRWSSPLYLISHVGTIISLVCLAVAIITFLLCRTLQTRTLYIHLHLCICLFLAKILFLTGADKTDNQVSYPSSFVPCPFPSSPICFCSSSPKPQSQFHLRTFACAFPLPILIRQLLVDAFL